MRYVCVSDTHNRTAAAQIPDGDVLLHSGDFTMSGNVPQFLHFADWIKSLPHKHIVVIAGNHDWLAEENPDKAREILTSVRENVHYLHDQSITIDGHKIYGSPYQPEFYSWAFNLRRGAEIAAKWELIPDDTDVLLTHGPPRLIGDMVHRHGTLETENVGCADLSKRIEHLKQLKMHVYGHIHLGYGLRTVGGVRYVNASLLNDDYQLVNEPIVVDL